VSALRYCFHPARPNCVGHTIQTMYPDNHSVDAPVPSGALKGVGSVWAACLAIAAARRAGLPLEPDTQGILRHSKVDGWQLALATDDAARRLFELLKPLLNGRSHARPWVIAQLGQSLDACIATRSGDARFVNGPEILTHLHRLRALADAVIVGAGTVAIDDPQLTVRHVQGPSPVRVLFDPKLQLAPYVPSARVFRDGAAPLLWVCDASRASEAHALVGTAQVLAVPQLLRDDGTPAVAAAMAALHARGLQLLFVEGGGVTVSHFLAQRALDRLHLALAPLIIGNGRPGLQFSGASSLADCPRPPFKLFPMGADQLWDLDLAAVPGSR